MRIPDKPTEPLKPATLETSTCIYMCTDGGREALVSLGFVFLCGVRQYYIHGL